MIIATAPAAAFPNHSPCALTAVDRVRLDQLGRLTEPALRKYNEGLVFLDGGCLGDAKKSLSEASQILEGEANLPDFRQRLLGLARAASRLADSLSALERGDTGRAREGLREIIRRTPESVVTMRAVFRLSALLEPDAAEWTEVQSHLEILADRGFVQARRLLARRLVATGRAEQAVSSVERRIVATPNLQESLALRILLADLYARSGRLLEARLLIGSLDKSVGEGLLDSLERIEFLRVAADVTRRGAQAGDLESQKELGVFEKSLEAAQER